MILDLQQLLAPLSDAAPTGVNLREDNKPGAVYYRIKDARAAARAQERQSDIEAERGGPSSEWRTILDLTQEALATVSKDLEVAAWLTEAALRIHGFAGLRDAFRLMDGLMDRYWETLHSFDTETAADKVAPIAGLNGTGGEGALIQSIRLAAITAPTDTGPLGSWHVAQARRRGADSREAHAVKDAAQGTDAQTFIAIHADLADSIIAWANLVGRMDELCGPESPPSSNIRNAMEEALEALREISGLDFAALVARTPDVPPSSDMPAADTPSPVPVAAPAAYTREDALRELARVAKFFNDNEPHSPIAPTLETVIRRARLPLIELWNELIPDDNVRRACLSMAGIAPAAPAKTGS